MAGSRTGRSSRHNPFLDSKDELTGGSPGAPTKNNTTLTLSLPVSWAQTLAPPPVPSSTKKLCQQLLKTYTATVKLLGQNHGSGTREQPLKARFPNLYYGNSHKDCYRFCQYCENHFKTAGANRPNRISFSASFLRESIVHCLHQYEYYFEASEVLMIWAKFKDFLRKNLGDNQAFANSICSKFRQDSQYQVQSVLDWAAHLEHLQSILLEYNPIGAPTKPTMLKYFRKGLKPLVLAKLEYWDLELESFNQMVKKAVNAEAKSALWPCSSTKEMDQNCPWATD